jgi:hypothetical protein
MTKASAPPKATWQSRRVDLRYGCWAQFHDLGGTIWLMAGEQKTAATFRLTPDALRALAAACRETQERLKEEGG